MSDETKLNPFEEAAKQIAAKAAEYATLEGKTFRPKGDDNGVRRKVLRYLGVLTHGVSEDPKSGVKAHTFMLEQNQPLMGYAAKCADFLSNNEEVKE